MLVGREREAQSIRACLKAHRNVLLEGPVGVGKTHLAIEVAREQNLKTWRVDGDSRYSEQKLTGWFDPPTVIQKGYVPEAFVPGPLVEAMRAGGVLFINELNRMPEGVQNVLLPAIDERLIQVPKLGEVRAQEGFLVVATQNPKEFVATSHLSEAILDRFELVVLDYQPANDEIAIVRGRLASGDARLAKVSVALARLTRSHPRIRRGASVRAALAVAELTEALQAVGPRSISLEDAFLSAAVLALPTRVEIERSAEGDDGGTDADRLNALVRELAQSALAGLGDGETVKKKR